METISFILGIAFVVVIAVAAVATYAFVKVLKTASKLQDLSRQLNGSVSDIYQNMSTDDAALYRRIDELEKQMASQVQHVYKRIDDLEREVFSQLDSRLDKLESKLTKSSTKN